MPSTEKPYFEYTIRDTTIETVYDLLYGVGSFINGFANSTEFMSYNGGFEQGALTNADRIINAYTYEDQEKYNARVDYDNFPIIFGTVVLIPFSAIDRDVISVFGDAVISADSNGFLADQLKQFYTNPKNIRAIESTKKTLGNYKEMFNHISVWIWSKTLTSKVENGEIVYDDRLINVTPFVSNLTTAVGKDGGTFSFKLDPILAKFNQETNKWEIDDATIKRTKQEEYVAHSHIKDTDSKRKNFYFHNILQENDLVFIRFEALESESDRLDEKKTFELDKKELQFKIFDMIGLIDVQNQASNFATNDVSITVNGRDLMKLLIDDGVYFYPFDFVSGGIFANVDSDEERLRRYNGEILGRFQISYKKIDNVLKFIINALGTIKICSDNLFSSYQNLGLENDFLVKQGLIDRIDRRTHRYKLSDSTLQTINDNNADIIKSAQEEDYAALTASRKESGLINPNEDSEKRRLRTVHSQITNFLENADKSQKLTKTSWSAFTYLGNLIKDGEFPDQWYNNLYVRSDNFIPDPINLGKEPTAVARQAVQVMIKNFFKIKERNNSKDQQVLQSQAENAPLKGIWQIIKLIVDHTVQNRLVADSSIGNEHGSLINAIKKVCQEPFVEFFGDTYGDQYYFTVRKPPFDRQGYVSLLDGISLDEQGKLVSHAPIVVDIEDDDILDEQLQYGAEAFSWYHINPQGNFAGGDDMAFAYLRAIFLKEYADLFGSKPLDIVSNYIPFYPAVSKDQMLGESYMIKQGIYDLQYMIQSNAYLPFVRRGTITIANGNRRIKRGCLVRLVSTGEVGIVESVQHSASFGMNNIERTTTINIDRVIVEAFVKGVNVDIDGKQVDVSYFDLVDTTIPEQVFNQKLSLDQFNSEVIGKWKVNKDVFNFFLQARQFAY